MVPHVYVRGRLQFRVRVLIVKFSKIFTHIGCFGVARMRTLTLNFNLPLRTCGNTVWHLTNWEVAKAGEPFRVLPFFSKFMLGFDASHLL